MTTFESGFASVSDAILASQEKTRVLLATLVMALLLLVVGAIMIYIFQKSGNDSAKLMITGIFTPVIGITGTVLGFYFGSPKE